MKVNSMHDIKYYKSIKNSPELVYFTLKTEKTVFYFNDYSISLNSVPDRVEIKYKLFYYQHANKMMSENYYEWVLDCTTENISFDNSIMLPKNIRGFGIGTFMFHSMINCAVEYFPKASLTCKISNVHPYKFSQSLNGVTIELHNNILRDSMYKNASMKFIEGNSSLCPCFVAENIDDMNLIKVFPHIEEVELSNLLNINHALVKKNNQLVSSASIDELRIEKLNLENKSIKKLNKLYLFLLIFIVLVLLVAL